MPEASRRSIFNQRSKVTQHWHGRFNSAVLFFNRFPEELNNANLLETISKWMAEHGTESQRTRSRVLITSSAVWFNKFFIWNKMEDAVATLIISISSGRLLGGWNRFPSAPVSSTSVRPLTPPIVRHCSTSTKNQVSFIGPQSQLFDAKIYDSVTHVFISAPFTSSEFQWSVQFAFGRHSTSHFHIIFSNDSTAVNVQLDLLIAVLVIG